MLESLSLLSKKLYELKKSEKKILRVIFAFSYGAANLLNNLYRFWSCLKLTAKDAFFVRLQRLFVVSFVKL